MGSPGEPFSGLDTNATRVPTRTKPFWAARSWGMAVLPSLVPGRAAPCAGCLGPHAARATPCTSREHWATGGTTGEAVGVNWRSCHHSHETAHLSWAPLLLFQTQGFTLQCKQTSKWKSFHWQLQMKHSQTCKNQWWTHACSCHHSDLTWLSCRWLQLPSGLGSLLLNNDLINCTGSFPLILRRSMSTTPVLVNNTSPTKTVATASDIMTHQEWSRNQRDSSHISHNSCWMISFGDTQTSPLSSTVETSEGLLSCWRRPDTSILDIHLKILNSWLVHKDVSAIFCCSLVTPLPQRQALLRLQVLTTAPLSGGPFSLPERPSIIHYLTTTAKPYPGAMCQAAHASQAHTCHNQNFHQAHSHWWTFGHLDG